MLAAAVDSATDDGKTEEFPQMAPPLFTGRILRRVGSMLGTPRVVVFGGYHVCTAPSLTTLSVLFCNPTRGRFMEGIDEMPRGKPLWRRQGAAL